MSAFLFIIGLLLFALGSFGLYFGLYAAKNRAGEIAEGVRVFLSKFLSSPKTVLVIAGAALAAAGIALVVWGLIRSRREKKPRRSFDIHVLSVLAMLVAMTVMLDRFPGLSIKTAGWNIGFAFAPPMLAAMLYGPVEAAIVYGLSDLIGATLFPFGTYHPGFTVVAALMGFIMGLFLNKRPFAFAKGKFEWKKLRFFPNMLIPVLVNALALGLVVNTYWVSQLYGSKTYWGWFMYRLAEYAILVPVQLILIPVLLKLCDTLKKAGLAKQPKRDGSAIGRISRNVSILGLERITELLSLMGDPQEKLRVVHVAGTNGKGSFTAMLTSVLIAAGYTVGSFTSPAVEGPCDSFRINGRRITEEELEKSVAAVAPFAEKMKEKPTEFEVMTAAAYSLFEREGCDIAVVECGLGGDTDSTNVIKSPLLSVITNVQLDHTDRLGKTLAEIASHKAGIIKQRRPVVWGGGEGEAFGVISHKALEMNAPLTVSDPERLTVKRVDLNGCDIEFDGEKLHLSLLGDHQPKNALNVLTAVEALRREGLSIPEAAVKTGLKRAEWPARFEVLSWDPYVIFDGSHNPDGVALAASSIKKLFPKKKAVLLMGVMADKDYEKYPALLSDRVEKVFTVTPDNPRALDAGRLAACFANAGIKAKACPSMKDAVRSAYSYADSRGIPLIAMGTLYMYNDFKKALNGASKQ